MHVDERGVWSANVTLFGAWGAGMGYTFDTLMRLPPRFQPRRRMIDRGGPWFSLVDLELDANPMRDVPLSLHLAGITGTLCSDEIDAELFAKADLVIFYADIARFQLERTRAARRVLDAFIAGRDPALVVFQLDRPYDQGKVEYDDADGTHHVEEPPVMLTREQLRHELAIGDRRAVTTSAYNAGKDVGSLFRVVVEQLLAARDRLPRREPYEP